MMQEFPDNEGTFGMDDQFMLGSALVIKPVSGAGVTEVSTFLPNETKDWYDYDTMSKITVDKSTQLAVQETPIDLIPVYIRGGSIIARKDRLHRSSVAMKADPFTLVVALSDGEASGSLYVDDGHSFEYEKGSYLQVKFEFKSNVLSSKTVELESNPMKPQDSFNTRFERIIILGLDNLEQVKSVQGNADVEIEHAKHNRLLILKNPNFLVGEEWTIRLLE